MNEINEGLNNPSSTTNQPPSVLSENTSSLFLNSKNNSFTLHEEEDLHEYLLLNHIPLPPLQQQDHDLPPIPPPTTTLLSPLPPPPPSPSYSRLLSSLFSTFSTPSPTFPPSPTTSSSSIPSINLKSPTSPYPSCIPLLLSNLVLFNEMPHTFQTSILNTIISTLTTNSNDPNEVYLNVIRFRCTWSLHNDHFNSKNKSTSTLPLLLHLLHTFTNNSSNKEQEQLQVIKLVTALACTLFKTGVNTHELKSLFSLITKPSLTSYEDEIRLHIIKSLAHMNTTISLRSSKSKFPRSFFTFGGGGMNECGLKTTFPSDSERDWPFVRNFWGFKCWFQSNRFSNEKNENMYLMDWKSRDGVRGVEVFLEVNTDDCESATLVVRITDTLSTDDNKSKSVKNKQAASSTSVVSTKTTTTSTTRMQTCPILPKQWYFLSITHSHPTNYIKTFFSNILGNRNEGDDELTISINCRVYQVNKVIFPKFMTQAALKRSSDMLESSGLISKSSRNASSSSSPPPSNDDSMSPKLKSVFYGRNFDGQIGTVYVQSDAMNEEKIEGLMNFDSPLSSNSNSNNSAFDIPISGVSFGVHASSASSNTSVASNHSQSSSSTSPLFTHVFDAARVVNNASNESNATKQSRSALDIHSKMDLVLEGNTSCWILHSPQDAISSIGGIKNLLPLFRVLSSPSVNNNEQETFLLPSLFSLVSSFIRNHPGNARELLQCQGISAIEASLMQARGLEAMTILRSSAAGAKCLVDSLQELREASRCCKGLEEEVFVLLFNISMWLGDKCVVAVATNDFTPPTLPSSSFSSTTSLSTSISTSPFTPPPLPPPAPSPTTIEKLLPGVALHSTLLPVLSSICQQEPKKVREIVGISRLVSYMEGICFTPRIKGVNNALNSSSSFQSLNSNLSFQSSPNQNNPDHLLLFQRGAETNLPPTAPLTPPERSHITKVIFSMILTSCISSCDAQDLRALLNFINLTFDKEFAVVSEALDAGLNEHSGFHPYNQRYEIFQAAKSASLALLHLLQRRPPPPLLYQSLERCCGGTQDAVASWILTCMVNTFDDEIRGIGIRCLTAYIDGVTVGVLAYPELFGGPGLSMSAIIDERQKTIAASISNPQLSKRKSSGGFSIFKSVGESVKARIEKVGDSVSQTVGVNVNLIPGSLSSAGAKINTKIAYKLLWHRCKTHRNRLGQESHDALIDMIVVNRGGETSSVEREVISLDKVLLAGGGFIFNEQIMYTTNSALIDDSKTLRSLDCLNVIFKLLKFLPSQNKEKWLVELLTLLRVSPGSLKVIAKNNDWQPCLFTLVSEILEEAKEKSKPTAPPSPAPTLSQSNSDQNLHNEPSLDDKMEAERGVSEDLETEGSDIDNDSGDESLLRGWGKGDENESKNESEADDVEIGPPAPELTLEARELNEESLAYSLAGTTMRFDLSIKLYSMLLSHAIREGGEQAFKALETAASLQRVCVNGIVVFSVLFSHIIADLTDNGTIVNIEELVNTIGGALSQAEKDKLSSSTMKNRALKQSVFIVTAAAASSSSSSDAHMKAAITQWRCLCHITVITVAIITKLDFGVIELLNHDATAKATSADEELGIGGIKLGQSNIPALNCVNVDGRVASVTLVAQLLTLLDAFIFPGDGEETGKSYGMALVRATEQRLGQAQGPILASLIRLSVLLVSQLEPCSVKFLHACGRLRCFSGWLLTMIRESNNAESPTPFSDANGHLDRLAFAIILHSHRALERCARMLSILESRSNKFESEDERKRTSKRVIRASHELREIISILNNSNFEFLESAFHPEAYRDLKQALSEGAELRKANPNVSRDVVLRLFFNSAFVRRWHDQSSKVGEFVVPEIVSDGQIFEGLAVGKAGRKAIEDLSSEGGQILKDYESALNAPFDFYLNNERQWAETDAVRNLEDAGDKIIERMVFIKLELENVKAREMKLRTESAESTYKRVKSISSAPWSAWNHDAGKKLHWKLSKYTDKLHRRILLERNYDFNDHEEASYQGGLEKERERAEKSRVEREDLLRMAAVKAAMKAGGEEQVDEDSFGESGSIGSIGGGNKNSDGSKQSEFDSPRSSKADELEEEEEEEEEWNVVSQEEGHDGKDEFGWAKQSFAWDKREKAIQAWEIIVVGPEKSVRGYLLLTTHAMYFHPEKEISSEKENESTINKGADRRWMLNRLTAVYGRRYILRPQALELFFVDSHEVFMSFEGGAKTRDRFYAKLRTCNVPMLTSFGKSLSPQVVFSRSKLAELWKKRKISNFEYLIQLNTLAGRSFNDITQYPVFPWVLCDYKSESIDLDDPKVYRDLSKPIGALNEKRLRHVLDRYHDLDGFDEEYKFLYGSHYSSPGVVLHYLLRQEPFATLAIDLQGGRFDCPDRLFFDISSCWDCCMTNTSDVKELIPEFFFCPEIFVNSNNFPLGDLQDDRGTVNDVVLPPWAKGSPHEFVRINRAALESEHVSANLHSWIDLIFGCLQRGEEALGANNLFHHLSYEGSVDIEKIEDKLEREAAEAHIMNFGQTPSQLLTKRDGNHPKRLPLNECWIPLCSSIERLAELRMYTPPKQFGGRHNGKECEGRGGVTNVSLFGDTLFVAYENMSVGTYKWSAQDRDGFPFTFKCDRICRLAASVVSTCGRTDAKVTFGFMSGNNSSFRSKTENLTLENAFDLSTLKFITSGYWDKTVKLHTADKLHLLSSTTVSRGCEVICIGLCSDFFVVGCNDGTCRVYIVDNNEMAAALSDVKCNSSDSNNHVNCCHILNGHDCKVTDVKVSSVCDVVVSGDEAGIICIHALSRGLFVRLIDVGSEVVLIGLGGWGEFVVYTSDGKLSVWTSNAAKTCSVVVNNEKEEILTCVELTNDGKFCITGSAGGLLKIYATHDLSLHAALDFSPFGGINTISMTPPDNWSVDQYMFVGHKCGMVSVVSDPKHRLLMLDSALQSWAGLGFD